MRILVLEDYFPLRQQMVDLIEGGGYEALSAADASEATRLLKDTVVDAVIADILVAKDGRYVPEGGLLLISRIRNSSANGLQIRPNAPILATSGGVEIEGGYSPLRLARDLGANHCLKKPVEPADIAKWLAELESEEPLHP